MGSKIAVDVGFLCALFLDAVIIIGLYLEPVSKCIH